MNARRWAIIIAIYVGGGLVGAFAAWGLTHLLRPIFVPLKGVPFYLALTGCLGLWVGVMFLLHRAPAGVRKRITIIVTFAAGLFYVLEHYLPAHGLLFFWRPERDNPLSPLITTAGNIIMAIAGFTFFLAAFSLTLVHAKNIAARRRGYYNSIAFFAAFIAMATFGLWYSYAPAQVVVHRFLWIPELTSEQVHGYLFRDTYIPLGATLFSVLAFYMATAAFRAFRVRTAEAGFMMVSAFIVMLGQVPLGMWLTDALPTTGPLAHLRLEAIANWILGVFSMAGLRAVAFGVLVGGLAMSLRIWLSLERGAFFEQEM